jgi:hypothetical protein
MPEPRNHIRLFTQFVGSPGTNNTWAWFIENTHTSRAIKATIRYSTTSNSRDVRYELEPGEIRRGEYYTSDNYPTNNADCVGARYL